MAAADGEPCVGGKIIQYYGVIIIYYSKMQNTIGIASFSFFHSFVQDEISAS